MKINYFLLCENFVRDNNDRVSLVNIFDNVNTIKLPVIPPKFNFVFSVAVTKDDVENGALKTINIKVTDDSSGEKVLEIQGKNDTKVKPGNAISNIDLGGKIAIKKAGKYTARLYVNNKVVPLPFSVHKLKGD